MSLNSKVRTLGKITKSKLKESFSNSIYQDSYENAYRTLYSYSPMPSSSSICHHSEITPKYDLTIIIPAFNAAKWIEQCLNSALNQNTDFDYRVIVINERSTNCTGKLIGSFADKKDYNAS